MNNGSQCWARGDKITPSMYDQDQKVKGIKVEPDMSQHNCNNRASYIFGRARWFN